MKLSEAQKLHNGDQVQIKDTGEFVTVVKSYTCENNPSFHCINAMTKDGYRTLSHLEIK